MSRHVTPFVRLQPEDAELQPAPLPAGAVIAGDPQPRSTCVTRPRGDGLAVGTWECNAGSFRFPYMTDETVQIVSGSARVVDEQGMVTTLRTGDWASFTAGDVAIWEIDDHVRKVWVTTAVNQMHSRVLLRTRTLARRVDRRYGRAKTTAAAIGGSTGFAGAIALRPI